MSSKRYNQETVDFIKANYLDYPVKRLAAIVGGSYCGVMGVLKREGLTIPQEVIEQRKKESRYQKGVVPATKGKRQSEFMTPEAIERTKKTRFKKGHRPHNQKYNGHERISTAGYTMVRTKKGNYRLKHLLAWEKINGKLPKDHCLTCIDGNKQNTDPSNWRLISRAENMLLNSVHKYPKEIIPGMVLINKISNQVTVLENGK